MSPAIPESVTYSISPISSGWLLVMQNPHCSLSQVFQSSASARQALPQAASALDLLTAQHLEARRTRELNPIPF